MTTLAAPLTPSSPTTRARSRSSPTSTGRALYFSRSRIPATASTASFAPSLRHHLGLYAFRADFLPAFARLQPTPLEQVEQLEQLRALEHGYTIVVGPAERSAIEINTAEDFGRAEAAVQRSQP